MSKSTYKILKWEPSLAGWQEAEEAQIEAAGSLSAVKTWAERHGADGTYVAVPVRSFKPVTVVPQTGVKITPAG